jgi:hypothetical protein
LRTKEKSFVRTYQLEIIEKNVICGQNRAFFFIHFFLQNDEKKRGRIFLSVLSANRENPCHPLILARTKR